MLSVLIPTYNHDITKLVSDLYDQAAESGSEFEIIVMDDASDTFTEENSAINQLAGCKYIILPANVGRGPIRNKLADEASGEFLLFMDCDAEIMRHDFILRYLAFCSPGEEVAVIGGTAYDENSDDPDYSLRLKYGREREANILYLSEPHAKGNFATFNFLISKETFNKVRFDENISGYGHEDTLFGYQLKEAGYEFIRIDNPLIHKGLDKNDVFLRKTEESVRNLYRLYMTGKYPFLESDSKLLHYFSFFRKYHLIRFVDCCRNIIGPCILRNLTGKKPDLKLYDLYKLMFLSNIHVNADKMTENRN